MFGPLNVPRTTSDAEGKVFPHNVAFCTSDWVASGSTFDGKGYDVVLACVLHSRHGLICDSLFLSLSITKWIHLNDGDDGIRAFFARVHAVLRQGGMFVLEVQPWDSYAKARRSNPVRRTHDTYTELI